MRILQVRFKNLNSLVGEWTIDLTHPAYAADGIFAITGPTGAGKTTILDAICLALYGRTPRLSKVTKSGNEVMSRQTGECFAEVTFETQAGRYRCHWSQHRARRKADGELQAPKHEIANADSGQIFEAKLRGVADQIEACTGMDFDRFTRSMLLAQGGFAAFLQAAADERAPILEQITGTEIYSQISVRVHELRKKERDILEQLAAALQGLQPLSEEELRQLSGSLEEKRLREAHLRGEIALHGQAIAWLDGIVLLEEELRDIGEQQQRWQSRQEAFAPQREQLQQAGQALELSGDYAGLSALRREQQSAQQNHAACQAALPRQEAARQDAEETLRQAAEQLEGQKTAHKERQPLLRQVRELDVKIREKAPPILTAKAAVAERQQALALLRGKQEDARRALGAANTTLGEVLQQLDRSKADEGLVEEFSRIRDTFEALAKGKAQLEAKGEEVRAAGIQTAASLRAWNDQVAREQVAKRALDGLQQSLQDQQLQLQTMLDGRALTAWRNELVALKERKALLDNVTEALRSAAEARQELAAAAARCTQLHEEQRALAAQLQRQLERAAALEREVQLLEVQAAMAKQIQSLESARRQLEDGQPCPLCGAREHPFAAGSIPVADQAAEELAGARDRYRQLTAELAALQVKKAVAGKDLEQILARQTEWTDRLAAAQAQITQGCRELAIDAENQALEDLLAQRQQETLAAIVRGAGLVQRGEDLEREIGALRDGVEASRAAVVQAERQTQEALHRRDSARQSEERGRGEAAALDEQYRQALAETQSDLATYGITALPIEGLERVRRELAVRREAWLARQKDKSTLEQRIAALEIDIRHQHEQLQKGNAELGQGQETLRQLQEEEQVLGRERRRLFGDQDADAEEARLAAAVETAERGVETARQALQAAGQQFAALQSRMEELAQALTLRAASLASAEAAFLVRLLATGFADEESFTAARLPEEERKRLLRQAQELATEQAELAAREKEKTSRLAAERQKAVTACSRRELEERLQGLTAEQRDLQQEIGAIRQKLRDNEELKERQRGRIAALEIQKQECSRWDLLHELIGSSDGKKYRNFAQGLTFEMMVAHANRQLRKMSDRYLLIRDAAQPLELNIIDSYQAGEIRSTKNLSGGESFIVSLALALGLSQMASRNIRVDSLFLDEGFGTLDDEALNTALETLAGLQQDGKLIGVISHVQALKDRIGTQIQVSPLSGGRSALRGPGCKKLDQQLTDAA